MARTSAISWTDATWNPWYGCTKISPGCRDCYMFRWAARTGRDPEIVVRSKTSFYDPLKWDDEPLDVFTCSLSDFFHPAADAWRDEAWSIIDRTRHCRYLITTKRVDLVRDRLPWKRKADAWPHVIVIASAENQKYFDLRAPELYALPVLRVGWSLEPLLGPIDLHLAELDARAPRLAIPPHWVIAGGLSGGRHDDRLVDGLANDLKRSGAFVPKPDAVAWVRSLRDQCRVAGVPFHFKQWGGPLPTSGGRHLDGVEHNDGPKELPR